MMHRPSLILSAALLALIALSPLSVTATPHGELERRADPNTPLSVNSIPEVHDISSVTEEVPKNFICKVAWRPHGIFFDYGKVLIFTIDVLALLASQPFSKPQPTFQHSNSEGLTIKFRSSPQQVSSGLQIKTMMWSLRSMAWWFMSSKEELPWREVGMTIQYRDQPILGIGQLLSSPIPTTVVNSTLLNNDQDIPRENVAPSNEQLVKVTDLKNLEFEPKYNPVDMYYSIINLIIETADKVPEQGFNEVAVYNNRADATLAMGSTNREDPLTYWVLIVALAELGNILDKVDPRYRWRQTTFLIRDGRKIVGRGAWVKKRRGSVDEIFGGGEFDLDVVDVS